MTPQEILEKAAKTLKERGGTYGEYENSLGDVGLYWQVFLDLEDLRPRDVAMMMILLKVARAKKSPNHADNYIDICGYAALAGGLVDGDSKS